MQDPRERLLRYLDDAHSAEIANAAELQNDLDESREGPARTAIEQHLMQTKDQALRLEKRLRALGGEPSGTRGAMGSLFGRLGELLYGTRDPYDRVMQNLIKAYATEYLEMGMYDALAAFARAYGDQDTASLAETIRLEEKAFADQLEPLIPESSIETFQACNRKAA